MKKCLSLCSHLKLKYFIHCETFLQRNQSDFFLESRGHYTSIKKFLQNGCPTALWGPRVIDLSIFSKQELQTSFRLRKFFTGALRQWRLMFLMRNFSLTENSVSDKRKAWMEIRLNSKDLLSCLTVEATSQGGGFDFFTVCLCDSFLSCVLQ